MLVENTKGEGVHNVELSKTMRGGWDEFNLLGLRICGCNILVSKSALVVGGENLKEMVGKVTSS